MRALPQAEIVNTEVRLSKGVVTWNGRARMTLWITYAIGNFRRTISLRCYVRGTLVNPHASVFEIDLKAGQAVMQPALQFRDAKNRVVSRTEHYWTLEDVEECHPDEAQRAVAMAARELALR